MITSKSILDMPCRGTCLGLDLVIVVAKATTNGPMSRPCPSWLMCSRVAIATDRADAVLEDELHYQVEVKKCAQICAANAESTACRDCLVLVLSHLSHHTKDDI